MYDTVVIGGGPAGSTVATLLRKYDPDHRVLVLEREAFPRDHVGESQLPLIGQILDEMGVWDKVEAANFPIKIGATYRWGASPDLWNFEFVPNGEFRDEARPARYEGQRQLTAFQVDRAVYDEILLQHAESVGAEVRQRTKVVRVHREGDRVQALELDNGERITARHYVDASGGAALLRKAMEVPVDSPSSLRNIAIWDYWQNAKWAEEVGVGGTRVQVMSLGYGWIWFIPLSPTRTSVGLIVPAAYYKSSGIRVADLYARALAEEPRIRALLEGASCEGKLSSTNDWSYVAERLAGENWFLAGDSCGFADPILAAGMTLSHGSAREAAFTILELDRGELDSQWLRETYTEGHRRRIRQHIRFADYWYCANGQFSDLIANTREIAKDAGLDLSPDQAFQWLGTGGFANDDLGQPSIGTYSLSAVKHLTQLLDGSEATYRINDFNEFRLDMAGVTREARPSYHEGRVYEVRALVREGRVLPLVGPFLGVVLAVEKDRDLSGILRRFGQIADGTSDPEQAYASLVQALEAMVAEGWIKGGRNRKRPFPLQVKVGTDSPTIRRV